MAVLHTVAVAADTVVVAELELHTVAVVQKSVVNFGLIGLMRSRDDCGGLIGRLPIGQMGSRVEFPVVSVRNRHT